MPGTSINLDDGNKAKTLARKIAKRVSSKKKCYDLDKNEQRAEYKVII